MNHFYRLVLIALLPCSCAGDAQAPEHPTTVEPAASIVKGTEVANPASTHCESNGGTLEIQSDKNGEFGVCIFTDGSRCEEWAFLRKQCEPGQCQASNGQCS